ncbi:hypothetical protein PhiBTCVTUL1a_54 [Burkholderia phage phiBtTUL1a]|nr:hypothetical protein PhiBTCVTUL1a_54 [Burkholderia phage phiBtTUL1a]
MAASAAGSSTRFSAPHSSLSARSRRSVSRSRGARR